MIRPAYKPAQILLHWLSTVLVLIQLLLGGLLVVNFHIVIGMVVMGLTVSRLVLKLMDPPASDAISIPARIVHGMLYGFLVLLGASGTILAFADLSDVVAAVVHNMHVMMVNFLTFGLVLHIAAVAFHSLIRQKPVFGRMWLVRKKPGNHISFQANN